MRLPSGWCGLVGLKPSLGRVPIDPSYVGRVAGPMTRIVDDAALMMSVLSKPDRRDGMSLPPDSLNWKALEKSLRKLRLGLMLDIGVGMPLERPVRAEDSAADLRWVLAGQRPDAQPRLLRHRGRQSGRTNHATPFCGRSGKTPPERRQTVMTS